MDRQKKPGVQLMIRLSAGLKEALDKACAENRASLSAEITQRLKRTFREDEQRGGNELKLVYEQLTAAFGLGGRLGATAQGLNPDSAEQWLRDPIAFEVALANLNETARTIKASFARSISGADQ
jgi:hypothetical protein